RGLLLISLSLAACEQRPESRAIRLIDLFDTERQASQAPVESTARAEWRFDASDPQRSLAAWRAVDGVEGFAVTEGRLRGRSSSALPLLSIERSEASLGPGADELLHSVVVRLRASAGTNLVVHFDGEETLDPNRARGAMAVFPWAKSPLVAGDEAVTYTLTSPFPMRASGTRHVLLAPSDVPGAEFEVESIRLVFRDEHLASIPGGVSWQGLAEIYRETLVARAPDALAFDIDVPPGARLDLALGAATDQPVTFVVEARDPGGDPGPGGRGETLLRRTLTTADRWEPASVDLGAVAGDRVALRLRLESDVAGTIGLWGSPVIRTRGATPRHAAAAGPTDREPPQGVILVMVDTLRRDHLEAWGYDRETAPALSALAARGVRFADAQSQATWTKVSAPSILTGLYPPTHGIAEFPDRLPASAQTIAEVFRDGGYATLSFSSIMFTGKFSNLHQGFEELHEATSASDQIAAKTARVYVDRLIPWLERHREDPFFVFLHLFDPHDPYEPHPPHDTTFFDPSVRAEHEVEMERVRAFITDPLMSAFLMPSRSELEQAGVDADRFIARQIDWYDGSIRGFDSELARLLERLEELGLDEKTLVVFVSDHGEEFLDHGRSFHGQSVYGELTNVPLILSWPRAIAPAVVETTVENVDIMPTILELSGLPRPEGLQGRSLAPWLLGERSSEPDPRPAFSQMAAISASGGNPPPFDQAAYSIVDDGWKLIHNSTGAGAKPQFELYDHRSDPFDHTNVAAENPEVVTRLARQLAAWLEETSARRLADDGEGDTEMSQEELQRLRALGYIQ
ncbi:MAG TPA: sulfatase, partial [Thermoanaerobaculia bacterium]|nr:sulfatase [Thermoanaerobaculia bacterium]